MPFVARLYTGSSQTASLLAEVTTVDGWPANMRNLRAAHAMIDAADVILAGETDDDGNPEQSYDKWEVLKNKNGWNVYKIAGLSDQGYQPYQERQEHY